MIALLLTLPALAGQVSYEELQLEDVLPMAEAAVVVTLGAPAMVPVQLPVEPGGAKSCEPYAFGAWRVTVEEVLGDTGRGPELAAGQSIVVLPGDSPDLVHLSGRDCLEGVRKSPIFASFTGDGTPDRGRRIALLRWDDRWGWLEAVSGSWLDPKRAKAVKLNGEPGDSERPGPKQWMPSWEADAVLARFAVAGAVCDTAFPRGVRVTETEADLADLRAAIWGMRGVDAVQVTAEAATASGARCYASGPHRGLNVSNWCCRE